MTTVTFENAALASAVARAARVAPTKGTAFDKAAGILMTVRPDDVNVACDVRSTNLEVDLVEAVDTIGIDSTETEIRWRLPSALLSGLMSALPVGTGKTVTFRQERNTIHIDSGKMKASLQLLPSADYSTWDRFDPEGLQPVEGFAQRIASVSWACAKDSIPLSGVRIDGEYLLATDRYRMARVPCKVPVAEPITVPLDVLGPILRTVEDAKVEATSRHLRIMPDAYTQIKAILFDADYPQVERVMNMDADFDAAVIVDREALRSAIQRIMVVTARGDRYPLIRLTFTPDAIGLFTRAESIGEIEDEIDAEPDTDLTPDGSMEFVVHFTPNFLSDALGGTDKPKVKISFTSTSPRRMVKFTDNEGYEAWVMPRKVEKAP